MAGGWGSAKNRIKIGVFWDSVVVSSDGTKARISNPRVRISRGVNIIDSSNKLSVEGGAVDDGSWSNLNLDGSGEKTIKSVGYQWQTLTYGATKTVSFEATLEGVNYAGGTLTVTKNVTFPARAYDPPAAPSGLSVVRLSDTQHKINWTPNATSNAPYDSQVLERSTLGGAFVKVATLSGGSVATYTDATTTANSIYVWRIRATNSAGMSAYTMSASVYTTPAAPTRLTTTKSGTTITLAWTAGTPAPAGYKVYHSANGGAFTLLASPAGTGYAHTSVNTAQTHQYRVTATRGALESAYVQSSVVTLLNPPNAPTLTLDSTVIDADTDVEGVSWTHNPTDATDQTNANLRYRAVGDAWTDITNRGTADTYDLSGLTNGRTYEVQAQTKGDHASFGPWSPSVLFKTSAVPLVTITAPGSVVGASQITAEWSYYDPESTAQSGWQVTLYDALDAVLATWRGTGDTNAYGIPYPLANTTDYTLGVRVWDGDGLGSIEATRTFTTDFTPPPVPTITATELDPETGAVEIFVMIPEPDENEAPATRVQVLRDGVLVAEVDAAETVIVNDPIPPTNAEPEYLARAWSASPASADSAPTSLYTESPWIYLNGGEGFGTVARLAANATIEVQQEREKALHHFAGRALPVEFTGEALTRTIALSGDVAGLGVRTQWGTYEPWEELAYLPAPVCYRDPLGRRLFVSVGPVRVGHSTKTDLAAISTTLTEVGDD